MIVCQNCGYEGNEKYCSKCGQVLEAKRISLPLLIQEVSGEVYTSDQCYASRGWFL